MDPAILLNLLQIDAGVPFSDVVRVFLVTDGGPPCDKVPRRLSLVFGVGIFELVFIGVAAPPPTPTATASSLCRFLRTLFRSSATTPEMSITSITIRERERKQERERREINKTPKGIMRSAAPTGDEVL